MATAEIALVTPVAPAIDTTIWLEPIMCYQISQAASLFRDNNSIHRSGDAASEVFGNDAIGAVAPGALILGLVGGVLVEELGDKTIASHIDSLQLTRCFCADDSVGVLLASQYDKVKLGQRHLHLEVRIFRKRQGEVVEASRRNKPVYIGVCIPTNAP